VCCVKMSGRGDKEDEVLCGTDISQPGLSPLSNLWVNKKGIKSGLKFESGCFGMECILGTFWSGMADAAHPVPPGVLISG